MLLSLRCLRPDQRGIRPQRPQSGQFGGVRMDEPQRMAWLQDKWPAIVRAAKRCKGVILFEDEASFAPWGSLSYTWARQGRQPEVPTSGKRKGYKVLGLAAAAVSKPRSRPRHVAVTVPARRRCRTPASKWPKVSGQANTQTNTYKRMSKLEPAGHLNRALSLTLYLSPPRGTRCGRSPLCAILPCTHAMVVVQTARGPVESQHAHGLTIQLSQGQGRQPLRPEGAPRAAGVRRSHAARAFACGEAAAG